MVGRVQVDSVFLDAVTGNGLGTFKALTESSSKHLIRDHSFVTRKFRVGRVVIRIDVDQLDHPVAVCSGCRSK